MDHNMNKNEQTQDKQGIVKTKKTTLLQTAIGIGAAFLATTGLPDTQFDTTPQIPSL